MGSAQLWLLAVLVMEDFPHGTQKFLICLVRVPMEGAHECLTKRMHQSAQYNRGGNTWSYVTHRAGSDTSLVGICARL